MAQVFHPSLNTFARASIFGAVFAVGALLLVGDQFNRSDYVTEVGVARAQPVPFSHAHHVGDIGLDCRYCHNTVETSAFAGMPSTQVCLGCHSQIFRDAPLLAPVRESLKNSEPLRWTRVHHLEEFAYFNHSIHLAKGVGCTTCHGQVDKMPLMWKDQPLTMQWCLDCHRAPEKHLRPKDKVFALDWAPPADQIEQGLRLMTEYHIGKQSRERVDRQPASEGSGESSAAQTSATASHQRKASHEGIDAHGLAALAAGERSGAHGEPEKTEFREVMTNCSVCHR